MLYRLQKVTSTSRRIGDGGANAADNFLKLTNFYLKKYKIPFSALQTHKIASLFKSQDIDYTHYLGVRQFHSLSKFLLSSNPQTVFPLTESNRDKLIHDIQSIWTDSGRNGSPSWSVALLLAPSTVTSFTRTQSRAILAATFEFIQKSGRQL